MKAGVLVLLVAMVAGCSGNDETEAEISKVADTDNQSAPAESRLPKPLTVEVRRSDGTPVPRMKVRWLTSAGAATLSDSITVTDVDGRARADLIVGRAVGPYTAIAELATPDPKGVTFTANATPAPALTSISPDQFNGGSTITLSGTGLSAEAVVEIGGAPGRVTAGSATSLTVVAPVCLSPGQVSVRVRVAGANSNSLFATYTTPGGPLMLAVAEYASIDPAQLDGCATFPAAGPGGAEYLLAPQAVTGSPGVNAEYRLVGEAVVPVTVTPMPDSRQPRTAAARFHDFLRAEEFRNEGNDVRWPAAFGAPAAVAAEPINLNDRREFSVCNRLDCQAPPDFSRIQARARFVGDHVAIFQDEAAPPGGFTDQEFASLGALFDDVLYDVGMRNFGVESDVDENSVVIVLLTPVVNGLTPADQCETSIVTGFFYAIDIDPDFSGDTRANQAEVFYTFTADPQGTVTCTISKDQFRRGVPATFSHEFQHMISYNQHVLVRNAGSEVLWLNEGLSHLAEELAGLALRDAGNEQGFSEFLIGDLYDAFQFLKAPGANFLAFSSGGGTLAERGASWLFLRWLVDQFGTDIIRRMSETRFKGEANITNVIGEPITRLTSQWFLANYVSDLPDFTPPPRLTYGSWSFRSTFQSLNQQLPSRFDRPFPLVPIVTDGASLSAAGTLRAGSGDYFRVVQGASGEGFTVRLTDPAGEPVNGSVLPRLNVIRIR